jgi:hypothetical protein
MRPGSDQNTPFEQGRFEDLPERPRLPHRYADAQSTTVVVRSEPFGDIATHVAFYGPRDAPPLLLIHGLMTTVTRGAMSSSASATAFASSCPTCRRGPQRRCGRRSPVYGRRAGDLRRRAAGRAGHRRL